MSYFMYIDDIVMPVMPGAISYQSDNKNEVVELISGREINIPKPEGLQTLSFELLLPGVEYPFAYYADGLKSPSYFLDHFKKLKDSQKPFQLIIARAVGSPGKFERGAVKDLNWTNMKVTMEEYPYEENADNGYDIKASVVLKQWDDYATKAYRIDDAGDAGDVEEPTLTPVQAVRAGLPEGVESSASWTTSTDRVMAESIRMLMANQTQLASETAEITLRREGGTRTTTSEILLKATLVANPIGVVNYSVSGVLIDTYHASIYDETFFYRDGQNIFDIMAKRFKLSRSQTANVTKNGVTRYGLFSIVHAFAVGSGLKSLWDLERNAEYKYSAVSQGLKQFAPTLRNV